MVFLFALLSQDGDYVWHDVVKLAVADQTRAAISPSPPAPDFLGPMFQQSFGAAKDAQGAARLPGQCSYDATAKRRSNPPKYSYHCARLAVMAWWTRPPRTWLRQVEPLVRLPHTGEVRHHIGARDLCLTDYSSPRTVVLLSMCAGSRDGDVLWSEVVIVALSAYTAALLGK